MKIITFFLLISAALGSSCNYLGGQRIKGDGNVITQDRNITAFTGVDVSGAIDVVLTQDSAFSVKVETDNNLQELIEVYKDGDVLRIHNRRNFNLDPSEKTTVYVAAPAFKQLEVSGASTLKTANMLSSTDWIRFKISGASKADMQLKAPNVEADVNGASSAVLRGETRDLTLEGSGASDIHAFELLSETARVDISGAANAEVFASMSLEARASGASNVRYKGNATVNSNTSGASDVKKVQ
ncbi:MAG TPA: head GIN domain-containing protein [Chitinophagaceae bacterium]|nr:head GIN domain-containing protein [Chitinophagaceae bacterium]